MFCSSLNPLYSEFPYIYSELSTILPYTKNVVLCIVYLLHINSLSILKYYDDTKISLHLTLGLICAGDGPDPVSSSLEKRGLAVIVTCNYLNGKQYRPLEGADNDAMKMKQTLQDDYNFEVVLLRNEGATKAGIIGKLESISSSLHKYKTVQGKVIIFVFSGHGKRGNTIVSQDENDLSLQNEILPCFANENTLETPKLFFIDACRGKKFLKAVATAKNPEQQKELALEIGLQTNYRIDYATVEDYESYAYDVGSEWLGKVAQHLKDSKKDKKKKSLQEIMAEVKKEVWQNDILKEHEDKTTQVKQQPHTEDRLNCGVLYL